jgi:SAM-dependent methyltransferase
VLEHIPEPKSVLKEFHRVLKPGGALWLSAPLFFEEHERPYDFFRYTQYGLTHLLESAGFKIIQMEWLEGYYGTLAYQFKVAAKSLPLHPREYGGGFIGWMVIIPILFLKLTLGLSSLLMARLDLRKKFIARGQCKNYTVVAVKKTTSP